MIRTFDICGKAVTFKATASTMSKYFCEYNRDLIKDFQKAQNEQLNGGFSSESLIVLLRLAHIMAKQADPTITSDPEEWLDTFDILPVGELLPKISDLWIESMGASVEQKKE